MVEPLASVPRIWLHNLAECSGLCLAKVKGLFELSSVPRLDWQHRCHLRFLCAVFLKFFSLGHLFIKKILVESLELILPHCAVKFGKIFDSVK